MLSSIEIVDFKYTLENYIGSQELPLELKRYVLKEILEDITKKSREELLIQAQEREANKGE